MREYRRIIAWLAVYRLGYLALGGGVAVVAPWYAERRQADWVTSLWETGDSAWGHFFTWDGQAYLKLAHDGYHAGDPLCAFYPLWPVLLQTATPLFGGLTELAGLVLANLFAWIGSVLFYVLLRRRWGSALARDSLWLWLAFPGALYFAFPYTESLFFLLLMAFWMGLEEERAAPAMAAGFLLPLTRAIGVLVLLPLGWHLLERACRSWRTKRARLTEFPSHLRRQRLAWVPVVVLAGYATYFGLMYLWTGNPFEGFVAQRHYPNQPSVQNLLDLPRFAAAFANVGQLHGRTDSVLDRIMFVLYLLTLAGMWRLDRRYFWWGIGAGLIPAMSNGFLSYQRFVQMVFPIFMVLAWWCAQNRSRFWFYYYLGLGAVLQAWFLVRHMNLFWVA